MKPVPTMCNPVPNDRFWMNRTGATREVDGTCRRNTSRPETLCSKAFASKTGGWEVGFAVNQKHSLCSVTSGVMLCDLRSYAFRLSEHCFQTLRALLLDSQSIAFDNKEHVSRAYGVLLWTIRSTSLEHTEQCSRWYGACLYIHTEHCSR